MTKEISEDELEILVREKKVVIVDFSATWCGPCKSLSKILDEKVAPKLEGNDDVALVKIDIDKNRGIADGLQIQGVPTMMFFIKGQKVVFDTGRGQEDRIVGLNPQIDKIIESIIESADEE